MKPGDPGFRHEWLSRVLQVPGHHAAKIIAAGLWSFADQNGFCYPNIEQIAQRTGHQSDGRISKYLKYLAESDFIRIGRQKNPAGWNSNNYQLVLPTLVGSNSPMTNTFSGAPAPEKEQAMDLAPTGVGAEDNGDLAPTVAGAAVMSINDYVVDGVDTRPPPDWAVGRDH